MKTFLPISLLFLIAFGCASQPSLRSTMNEVLMGDRLGFTIEQVHPALPHGKSHDLLVHVYVRRQAHEYRRDFALELETAAIVLAALAETDHAARASYVDLTVVNLYGFEPSLRRELLGTMTVRLTQETLLELRRRKASPRDYSQNWKYVSGIKDQPDSQERLQYSDESIPRF
jgi:hypothetical protein